LAKSPKQKQAGPSEPALTARGTRLSRRAWRTGCIAVTAVAALFRCYKLGLKPFHHDEGVNGFFMTQLFREGKYAYNPHDYHGPTLYFFSLISSFIFGLNGISLRMVPVVFGIATVVLVFALRKYIGDIGALSAGLLLAVSPGAVYISRYFIHESLFVFFTLAVVVTILRWYETANVAYLVAAAANGALMFATKETAFVSLGVLVIAGVCIGALELLHWSPEPGQRPRSGGGIRAAYDEFLARLGGRSGLAVQVFSALSAFVIVYVIFFSSFFTHRAGVIDSFRAYSMWGTTGTKDHTGNGWYAYFWWSRLGEFAFFLLGVLGAAVALWFRRSRVALFICLWAWGLTAAYILIPYKTPWLALNFLVPMAIASGIALDWLSQGGEHREGRIAAFGLLAAATLYCGYQAIQLNFYHYDDDSYPYVYAHSKRELLDLVDEINRVAAKGGGGPATGIIITSPEYWPLPWYLRDYSRVGFHGQITPPGNAEMVIGRSDQRAELDSMLFGRYRLDGEYPLRPGVKLLLYVRTDLTDQDSTAPVGRP
jgi:uncharacterized protein (TIGR03663 family)